MPQAIDYKAVLDDLRHRKVELRREFEARTAQIDSAITVMEGIAASLSPQANLFERSRFSSSQAAGAFAAQALRGLPYKNKTIRDASYDCLVANGKPMKTRAIADAITQGGLRTSAEHLPNGVYSTLTREPDVFKVNNGWWELVEWEKSKDTEGDP